MALMEMVIATLIRMKKILEAMALQKIGTDDKKTMETPQTEMVMTRKHWKK
jgi:hypothetical protein